MVGNRRRQSGSWTEHRRAAWVLAVFLVTTGSATAAESSAEFTGPVSPFLRAAVERALAEALARLANGRCTHLFDDYRDPAGRTLSLNLSDLRQTARTYLESVRFADGGHAKICSDSGVFAFTHPHTATIYLCGERFASLARTNPTLAAALLVHEELHSLGLGENPPLSREITTRVLAACRATSAGQEETAETR